jgi:hypothetical protein
MKILFLLLFPLLSFAKPCGLTGTVSERIAECAVTKGNFVLVSTNEKEQEIYKDTKSGLIWGARIPVDFNNYGSQKACSDELAETHGLTSIRWRLPSIREFEQASSHGMKAALQNADQSYWSSSPFRGRRARGRRAPPALVYIWDGRDERTDTGDLRDAASVRCVGKD